MKKRKRWEVGAKNLFNGVYIVEAGPRKGPAREVCLVMPFDHREEPSPELLSRAQQIAAGPELLDAVEFVCCVLDSLSWSLLGDSDRARMRKAEGLLRAAAVAACPVPAEPGPVEQLISSRPAKAGGKKVKYGA